MIGYAPFEDLRIPKVMYQTKQPAQCTECNFIVLAFISSVFIMALFDALK